MAPTKAQRESRAARVAMLYEAVEGLPCEEALNACIAVIKDDKRFTGDMLERMGNELGREAHSRARLER